MTLYVASCLRDRHADVHLGISKALSDAGIPLVEVPGTGNIWIRDWMPIRCGDHYVKFRPKADTVKWPLLEVPRACWEWVGVSNFPCEIKVHNRKTLNIVESSIILDGGNVVRSPDGKRVIMCMQTLLDNGLILYQESTGKKWKDITERLENLLEAKVVWIPTEPGDYLGHSDGECVWIDNDAVFVNDFRSMRDAEYRDYQRHVKELLEEDDIETVPFPNAFDLDREITEERFRQEHPHADDFNSGYGFYLNFLKLDNLILYPTFGIDRDERCLDALLDAWPDAKCVGIDCGYLAEEGGLLHCISWSDD